MIDQSNWNYKFYQAPNKKAFIGMGGRPSEMDESIEISYLVTVTDLEGKDIFQQEYLELKKACEELNNRYGHWELVDTRYAKSSDSGCGSCEAH